jgi:hypothetical protein
MYVQLLGMQRSLTFELSPFAIWQYFSHITAKNRRDMAEILPNRRKTPINQSIPLQNMAGLQD